jgi:hypothetical protein
MSSNTVRAIVLLLTSGHAPTKTRGLLAPLQIYTSHNKTNNCNKSSSYEPQTTLEQLNSQAPAYKNTWACTHISYTHAATRRHVQCTDTNNGQSIYFIQSHNTLTPLAPDITRLPAGFAILLNRIFPQAQKHTKHNFAKRKDGFPNCPKPRQPTTSLSPSQASPRLPRTKLSHCIPRRGKETRGAQKHTHALG